MHKYTILTLLPTCILIVSFPKQVLSILFHAAPFTYSVAGDAMTILIVGMIFFSIYVVSSSVFQGLGKSNPPMIFLIIGSLINLVLTIFLVPKYGLNGAAISTTISSFIIMLISTSTIIKNTHTKLPGYLFIKIIITNILMGLLLILIPKTIPKLLAMTLITPFVYILLLAIFGVLEQREIKILKKLSERLGPLSNISNKIIQLIEPFAKT